jgi:hypothetical protein
VTTAATAVLILIGLVVWAILAGLAMGVIRPKDPRPLEEEWAPLDEHGNRVKGGGE